VAKIATNVGKPDGLVIVPPGEEAAFLAPMPLEMLFGAGPKTRARLAELGMRTIGDVAAWPGEDLARRFGELGRALSHHARGLDDRPVQSEHEAKSISSETTFARDVSEGEALRRKILAQSEEVGASLRREGLAARTVKIKVRWPPFETLTRQTTLAQPTDLDDEIYAAAWALFQKVWTPGRPVRLIGVGVSGLAEAGRQLDMFAEAAHLRAAKLARTIDALREKYGDEAVRRAALIRRRTTNRRRRSSE
jgi:DNA polymerase-4